MNDAVTAIGLGEEHVPAGEAAQIESIVALSLEVLDTTSKPVRRGQHPKHHGCVRAEFVIEPDLPDALRQGVFRAPGTFAALIRFSNGRAWDDRKNDVHGMAIKLLGVEGAQVMEATTPARTQDFVLSDDTAFFIRDGEEYARFSADARAAKRSWLGALSFVGRLKLSSRRPWCLLRAALNKRPDSPLRSSYWSQTPYRLGGLAVKYQCRPDLSLAAPPPPSESRDRLRAALAWQLSSRDARFDFLVQVQADPVAQPVEDPTVPWDESAAPFRKVATIRIPPQRFDGRDQMTFCENLSFTPWHALIEHRPLGGINRIRRVVYEAVSARRHEINQVPRREPTPDDLPPQLKP